MNRQLLFSLGLSLLSFTARAQWASQPIGFASPELAPFYLDAVDANAAWAVGSNVASTNYQLAQVARTVDGGQTWAVAPLPLRASASEEVTSLAALGPGTAWVTTVEYNGIGGRLLQTTNGGQTWAPQGGAAVFADPDSTPEFIRFFSATDGVAVGDPLPNTGTSFEVYITATAGQTWTRVTTLPATVRVLDVAGRLVQTQPWTSAAPLALDLSQQPAGLYVLEVQVPTGTARQKVVVQ